MLVIGSAAGIAFMGMENISFLWYLKKIAPGAAVGYVAGIITLLIQTKVTFLPLPLPLPLPLLLALALTLPDSWGSNQACLTLEDMKGSTFIALSS